MRSQPEMSDDFILKCFAVIASMGFFVFSRELHVFEGTGGSFVS